MQPARRFSSSEYVHMSDAALMVTVEDLISMAMGPMDKNVVDLKHLQTVLYILARQLRVLGQKVEIRESAPTGKRRKSKFYGDDEVSVKSGRAGAKPGREQDESEEEYDRPGKEKDTSGKEKYTLGKDKYTLGKEKDKSGKEKDTSGKEKDKSGKEKDKSGKEKDTSGKEKDKSGKEKDKSGKEKDKSGKEKDTSGKEMDTSAKEQDNSGEEMYIHEHVSSCESLLSLSIITKKSNKSDKSKGSGPSTKGEKGRKSTIGEKGRKSTIGEKGRKSTIGEKGRKSTIDDHTEGGIAVVTQSEFTLLKNEVKKLTEMAGPLPPLSMPDNEKLKKDLAKGQASLTDTMQAMQVNARVIAAEEGISRMADLLQQLAMAGALPKDVMAKVEDLKKRGMKEAGEKSEKGGRDEDDSKAGLSMGKSAILHESHVSPSVRSMPSRGRSTFAAQPPVTHPEMQSAMASFRIDMLNSMHQSADRALSTAEHALANTRAVAEKMEIATQMSEKISTLYSRVNDYNEQIKGFDAGFSTQMDSFKEQISQIQSDLKSGLDQLESINNNAETAAVKELNERYEGLVDQLDRTLTEHKQIYRTQISLTDQLQILQESVEMLREQKTDKDEVLDALRDKADLSRLQGLVKEAEFYVTRSKLEEMLEKCYDKFYKQDQTWMDALKDLSEVTESKAGLLQLWTLKDMVQTQLRDLNEMMHALEEILGEPETAILCRKLAKNGLCAPCQAPALMAPIDADRNAPPKLPALRPETLGADAHCVNQVQQVELPAPKDERTHVCRRWVGGSHTLLTRSVTREIARKLPSLDTPKRKYVICREGKNVYVEEDLLPCVECNVLKEDHVGASRDRQNDGGGDHVATAGTATAALEIQTHSDACRCD